MKKITLTDIDGNFITFNQNQVEGLKDSLDNKTNNTDLSAVATSGSYNDLKDKPIIPTRTSQLINDREYTNKDYVDETVASSISNIDMSNYYNISETDNLLNTKEIYIDIPTKVSQLENDSNFTTTEYVNNLLSNFSSLNLQVVSILPTENISTSTIYLLATNDTKENNVYEEWIYVNNKWELIGSTKVELPTKLSQLENDRNFIDNTVNNLINYYNKNESDDRYLNSPNFTGTVNIGGVTKLDGYSLQMYHPTDGAFYNVLDLNFRLSGGGTGITGNDENVIMFDNSNKFSKIFNGSCFFNKIIPFNIDVGYVENAEEYFNGSIGEAQKQFTYIYGKNIYQDGKKVANAENIPTRLSQLTNDSGFAYKSELFSRNYNDLTNKPTIPSKTSQLTNDSKFATTSYVDTKVSENAGGGVIEVANTYSALSKYDLSKYLIAIEICYGWSIYDITRFHNFSDSSYLWHHGYSYQDDVDGNCKEYIFEVIYNGTTFFIDYVTMHGMWIYGKDISIDKVYLLPKS